MEIFHTTGLGMSSFFWFTCLSGLGSKVSGQGFRFVYDSGKEACLSLSPGAPALWDSSYVGLSKWGGHIQDPRDT